MECVYVIEPECKGFQHSEFNSAFLVTLSLANPNSQISFFGDVEHLEIVSKTIRSQGYEAICDKIHFVSVQTEIQDVKLQVDFFKKIFAQFKSKGQVILTSCNTSNIRALDRLKQHCTICLHGILEDGIKRPALRPNRIRELLTWFGWILRGSIFKKHKWIVLSESIYKATIQKFPKMSSNLFFLDHPYLYSNKQQTVCGTPPVLGHLGIMNRGKGGLEFIRLNQVLGSARQRLVFKLVGFINDLPFVEQVKSLIDIPTDGKPLSRDNFWKLASQVDYALFFYAKHTYVYKASGAFFDAVELQKPIIALRNPFFEHYMNKYQIGWLFDSIEEMGQHICQLLENGNPIYDKQVQAMAQMKKDLAVDQMAARLKQILEA